ncbi:WD40 repeat domain-containing protein [Catellatospora bangladeshensis]|uniref:WD40 repeat domain-containing protein n=1 Tax=Catellatospora bangladeshensis TaxID=310355 RepID=A0A8J3NK73_9ACTN|nr:hypothetical protein [Catellatospora bangladeshensis]GIF82316.1 hypothetical protein Cba03nite_36650 [Catellatospora bangladeshensis]
MTEQQIAALLGAAPQDPEPPLRPGLLEDLIPAARRDLRRRRVTTVLCAVAALLAGAGVVLLPSAARQATPAQRPPGTATLPDRIAGYSPLTGSIADSPPGRAIMLYGYGNNETIRTYQSLVLGADGDAYRQVDAMPDRSGPWLLAPDGSFAVLSAPDRGITEVRVVDLATGRARGVPLPRAGGVIPLALSPDGGVLAYSFVDIGPIAGDLAMGVGNAIEQRASEHSELILLDLRTGQAVTTGVGPVAAAAFAPNGQRLAVQSRLETWLVGRDGRRLEQVMVPQGYGLTLRNAWSPSGRLLAVVPWAVEDWGTGRAYTLDYTRSGAVRTVSLAEPSALREGAADVETFLGWLSDDAVLGMSLDPFDVAALWSVPVDGTAAVVLSRFDDAYRCELGMQRCIPYEISVAGGLLPELAVRPAGSPDRGLWPAWLRLTAFVLLAVGAVGGWRLTRRLRRR